MMPRMGQSVLYHFDDGLITTQPKPPTMRARPAIVVDADEDGVCELHVFFSVKDRVHSSSFLSESGAEHYLHNCIIDGVPPHQEHAGEVGKIERQPPLPNTWSWPPWA